MLALFRKYQRFLFIIITVVIVISFSFFGTYGTMQERTVVDNTAFVAVDGSEIKRSQLEGMTQFLGTDYEDKLFLGGQWGPNFLNDGVIKKDFFETGMAEILAVPFLKEMSGDLQTRRNREKHYTPYQHPQAPFISAVNIWNIVAPDINKRMAEIKNIEDPASPEGFKARVALYLAERKFPGAALKMVLRNQQKQFGDQIPPDQALTYADLSLFGYHTIDDWFGRHFTRLAAEFVINSAIIAKERGYVVSRGEAAADLYQNAELSFQQNAQNPYLGVASSQDYLNEQLRRMGIDFNQAVSLWQQVMLFRRMFQDLGNSVLVDPQTVGKVFSYSNETVVGDLYQLPEELRLSDFRALQAFETYLSAVSERPKELLTVPTSFKKAEEVGKETPELIERSFVLEVAKVNKKDLQGKVSIKETWNWELSQAGWEKLKQKFPELGVKKGESEADRSAALDTLDAKTRQRVDSYARSEIVDENSEWLEESLNEAEAEKMTIGIRKKGENAVFAGLKDPEKFLKMLDAKDKSLSRFTTDDQTYYRIEVIQGTPEWQIVTFNRAFQDGTLGKLVDKKLKQHYEELKKSQPKEFEKPFEQVKVKVAEDYFANILKEIKAHKKDIKEMINDYAASIRLMPFMEKLKDQFKKNKDVQDTWVKKEGTETDLFSEQWKIERRPMSVDRTSQQLPFDTEKLYSIKGGDWTDVQRRSNGDLVFFQLTEIKAGADPYTLVDKVLKSQHVLSADVQKVLMKDLTKLMIEKNALIPEPYAKSEESES